MRIVPNSSRLVTALVGALALVGCDNGVGSDASGNDATSTDTRGTTDTGPALDTGTALDTGVAMDTGTVTDTGVAMDTGTVADTGSVTDTGTTIDTGPAGTPLNGCTSFTNSTTITFAGTSYTPNCIDVAAGTMVTFSGPFTLHPLRPGRAPSRPASDSPSAASTPITNTDTGTSANFTFAAGGDYGFYCAVHESLGMYGVVRVH